MNAKNVLVSAFFISLLGCATTPVPTDSAREVSSTKIINSTFLEYKDGLGQVIIKRDKGLSASACNSRVYANGSPVADIAPGEKVTFYLPEGQQMLAAKSAGICIGGLVETVALVHRTTPAVFRISYGSSGEFSIHPTAF
ncbi:hypothetical protein [Halomonas heilongjiangensis]|uniref:hypothetical protein n=1 Tax=Halomonas heilongjiangensis TaxID=1387883 RepID=UPI0011AFCBC1|nr:hypothetical protein [Halomonas heilongjiangensis]